MRDKLALDRPHGPQRSDIRVIDEVTGEVIYTGPILFRCTRGGCNALITHGIIREHGACNKCGNPQLQEALNVSVGERLKLKAGLYPMTEWEEEYHRGRKKVFRYEW